jgi:hypothetical protein
MTVFMAIMRPGNAAYTFHRSRPRDAPKQMADSALSKRNPPDR